MSLCAHTEAAELPTPASGPGSDCSGGEQVASLLPSFRVK